MSARSPPRRGPGDPSAWGPSSRRDRRGWPAWRRARSGSGAAGPNERAGKERPINSPTEEQAEASLDAILRAAFALGASRDEVGRIVAKKSTVARTPRATPASKVAKRPRRAVGARPWAARDCAPGGHLVRDRGVAASAGKTGRAASRSGSVGFAVRRESARGHRRRTAVPSSAVRCRRHESDEDHRIDSGSRAPSPRFRREDHSLEQPQPREATGAPRGIRTPDPQVRSQREEPEAPPESPEDPSPQRTEPE